jgi:hypothetical protein
MPGVGSAVGGEMSASMECYVNGSRRIDFSHMEVTIKGVIHDSISLPYLITGKYVVEVDDYDLLSLMIGFSSSWAGRASPKDVVYDMQTAHDLTNAFHSKHDYILLAKRLDVKHLDLTRCQQSSNSTQFLQPVPSTLSQASCPGVHSVPPEQSSSVAKECQCGGDKLRLPHSSWCPKHNG